LHPFFLPSVAGKIFCIYYPPPPDTKCQGNILFIPPFAEELNRSRHMISRQARWLAQQGYAVLVPDLYGTGDSQGTYAEANPHIWHGDLQSALSWLQQKSDAEICFWSLRTGALLLPGLLRHPNIQPNHIDTLRLVLWAPVLKGKNFIVQFLRIKTAAALTQGSNTTALTTKALQEQLDQGQTIEIGGYSLTPQMASELSQIQLSDLPLPAAANIRWFEMGSEDSDQIPPAANKLLATWQTKSANITAKTLKGPAFWTLQEPEWSNLLIDETLQAVKSVFNDT